jgi:hypothetical protein
MFEHPVEQGFAVAVITFLLTRGYDAIFGRKYMSPNDCGQLRKLCLAERDKAKLEVDGCFEEGESQFVSLEKQLNKIETFVSALMETQLALCKGANIDCSELTKLLAQKGIIT